MKWKLFFVGKSTHRSDWEQEYEKRIGHTQKLEVHTIKPGKGNTGDEKKQNEAKAILSKIDVQDAVFVLDEIGKNYTTHQFVEKLTQHKNQSQTVVFVIGGAYGTDKTLKARANQLISFSAMTWTYDLCRLMLLEQLYRTTQIMAGKPFHKD
jgi:23S rRNA (pseudouridine1915-N3)-methyltransferase